MIFTIFRDFFRIFWFYFLFKNVKNKYKKCKNRAGPARVRRGTQGHVAEPRGPAQRAYVAHFLYLYYIYLSYIIRFFSLPYMGRVIPLEIVGSYKPDGFLNIFRVGLILPECRWRGMTRGVGSAAHRKIHTSIWWTRTTDRDQNTCDLKCIITMRLPATWRHQTRRSRGARTTDHDQDHVWIKSGL